MCCYRLWSDRSRTDPEADRRKGIDFAQRGLKTASDDPDVIVNAALALSFFGEDIEAMRALVDRTRGFRRLQRGLDEPATLEATFLLKVEDVFQWPIEMIGPHMRPGAHVDQLSSDADPITTPAHRAFEHVADTEFATDPLHIDILALIGEARITGGDE